VTAARILQFGTSRFLQAHVDLFVHEAGDAGQEIGPITVVKTTTGGARDGRVRAFGDPSGFPVIIRGLVDGVPVERTVTVRSVVRGLSAHEDWPEVRRIFAVETEIVVCNTGDNGYTVGPEDDRQPPLNAVGHSFPAKLLMLLLGRYESGAAPLTVLPCELVSGNGRTLRRVLAQLAERWALPAAFTDWMAHDVVIADTLVDRIVSAPIEPVGAVAEPYALWAIQRCPGLNLPLQHPDIVLTDTLEPYERLKLHILNLGHTFLADIWHRESRRPDETVREIMSDPVARSRLANVYETEVLPGFAARGMAAQAERYVPTTLERFSNPFLDHRISDIWQNHATKVERRVQAFLEWSGRRDQSPILQGLADGTRRTLT
jgi:tagaturonate reductase